MYIDDKYANVNHVHAMPSTEPHHIFPDYVSEEGVSYFKTYGGLSNANIAIDANGLYIDNVLQVCNPKEQILRLTETWSYTIIGSFLTGLISNWTNYTHQEKSDITKQITECKSVEELNDFLVSINKKGGL